MNYYKRHLGDYARDTGHLSMLEHGAYGLLLDRYYATERGIPAADAYRICRARSAAERAAVDAVLAEFFVRAGETWAHGKCDAVIAEHRGQAETNRRIAVQREATKRARSVHEACNEPSEKREPSHKPVATSQKKKDYGACAPESWIPQEIWSAFCEHRRAKHAAIKTDKTVALIVADLREWRARGVEPATVLEFAIKNGHTGIYYKPENQNGNQANRKLSLSEESELDLARLRAAGRG